MYTIHIETDNPNEAAKLFALLSSVDSLGETPAGDQPSTPKQKRGKAAEPVPVQPAAPAPTVPATPVPVVPMQPAAPVPVQPAAPTPMMPAQPTMPQPVVPTVPAGSAPQYTLEQLSVACSPLVSAGQSGAISAILVSMGVNALTQLPQQYYGAFAAAIRNLGAHI